MATALPPKQTVSSEELITSQVIQQEALTRLLIEKGIFIKEELLEMVKVAIHINPFTFLKYFFKYP